MMTKELPPKRRQPMRKIVFNGKKEKAGRGKPTVIMKKEDYDLRLKNLIGGILTYASLNCE